LLFWNSQEGDYAGQGAREVYALANSHWTAEGDANGILLVVESVADREDSKWLLRFQPPVGQMLVPGVYDNASTTPTASTPGIEVLGNGRGCSALGRFVIHEIAFSANVVSNLALDFEVHCNPQAVPPRPLIGSIRYNSSVPVTASLALTFAGQGSVTLSPSGTICTSNCTETAAVGTAYAMTAQPDPGWSFVSWTGDEDCVDGSLTLTAPTACHAMFQQTGLTLPNSPPIGP
jgi:hypothetical protein